jgi:endonuclease/exonuclease/phosphatase family metal-dependent hydrolase
MQNGLHPTRDILVATGIIGHDTLNVCVVHLPSRRNNNSATVRNRYLAVETLCEVLDSLQGQKTLVMGDFNAEPGDKIFNIIGSRLVTLLPAKRKTLYGKRGTYYFKGEWGFLDHILVSPELYGYSTAEAQECRFPWLLRTDKQIPHRTYGGTSYLGGLSDHLPLIADFVVR